MNIHSFHEQCSDTTRLESGANACARSPLQKLEIELKQISKEDGPSPESVARSLSRRHERRSRGTPGHSRGGSGSDDQWQNTMPSIPGSGLDGHEERGRPAEPPREQSYTAAGIQNTRDFLHHHNPLHRFFGRSQENLAAPPQPTGEADFRHGPKPKVAHLTLEDMQFDETLPVEIIEHDGMGIFGQNNGGAGKYSDSAPVVKDGLGPAGRNHLQAPHIKDEREDALTMAYLRAIPASTVPDSKTFSPPLTVTCGPLLRYLDMTKSRSGRETWRGSIMIVTRDEGSDYSTPPVARLFFLDSMPAGAGYDDQKRQSSKSGEKQGKFKEISGFKLNTLRGISFWRFSIEVELADEESRIAYRVNNGPLVSFWVPARGQTMNIMFHSCNGFSLSVNPDDFCGPDPLWKDVLDKHQTKPFHVMIGGGDQIYNDAITKETKLFQAWLSIKVPFQKSGAEFTSEMAEELEDFYLNRYSMWFSQGAFGVANSQIPMVNIWDDHDIIDGYGSYPNHFNGCPVFIGLGSIAFKYYMLFQQQSTAAEMEKDEPTWVLGAAPGPFIPELSRSILTTLGRDVALLGLDCRTERMVRRSANE